MMTIRDGKLPGRLDRTAAIADGPPADAPIATKSSRAFFLGRRPILTCKSAGVESACPEVLRLRASILNFRALAPSDESPNCGVWIASRAPAPKASKTFEELLSMAAVTTR